MSTKEYKMIDGNEAVAHVAYRLNEVCAIYPITPSSNMGEWADAWMAEGRKNIWGTVPSVVELQSEGGAAGAVHGSLQTGSLTTTFTASQGLLLMIPNMYKIAGELTPTVFHIAARALAAQALSIFGDHSDVMSTRMTGWGMLSSCSVQEAMDFAAISTVVSLNSRLPFLHFFDGFRTSHEVAKVEMIPDEVLKALVDESKILEFRSRALSSDRPVLRGTAQNPDVYFQARETVNSFYDRCPEIVQQVMDKFKELTGREYKAYQYYGHPEAERVVVLMGSGVETAVETVNHLVTKGEKVGLLKVRMYRPFQIKLFIESLPATTKALAVLDRTKEPGANGEPLYLDCMNALQEGLQEGYGDLKSMPRLVAGRYGLSSKEFTPAMVKAVLDNLSQEKPKNHFTVGIVDDVTHTHLVHDPNFSTEADDVVRAVFYGLGADGTVGANKNSIKIIGENTGNFAQGYFVYDSKKSGSTTVSHLRFGPNPIHSTYLVTKANFIGCHQTVFLNERDMLSGLVEGGTFLLNIPATPETVWEQLPMPVQKGLIEKKAKLYIIDAATVAREAGMGKRINTIMQVCFFATSGVLPREEAIKAIKNSIIKTYGTKGQAIVDMNIAAVDNTLANLFEVNYPKEITNNEGFRLPVPNSAPDFVKNVLGTIISGNGDSLPVSAFPIDGTFPTATAQYEKRNISLEIPVWDEKICIQCGKCAMVCPHSVIRIKAYDPEVLASAPATFKTSPSKGKEWAGMNYTIQVAPEDCTGCGICVDICPAKNKQETRLKAINMMPQPPIREQEVKNWEFFQSLPPMDRSKIKNNQIRQQQAQEPLFEFSGACAGCGETPYVKLVSQLFGDRMLIANATGCSSIYGGNLPTTPWSKNAEGRGPAWSNSLFEDNAEFGLGYRMSLDKQVEFARELTQTLSGQIGGELAEALLNADQSDEPGIFEQRKRVDELKSKLVNMDTPEAKRLLSVADLLSKKSVWIMGGDGWAYDIGFGGLDHVLASGRNINILVLDTEVYSNTGGQTSKSTPMGAVAKFSAGGKPTPKKDLGMIAMSYGNVYVASVAMGAKDEHTLKSFLEAEAYPGVSLIIAYSHCIAHGIDMTTAMQNQKAAVASGHWLLYRYNPALLETGENPLKLDSPPAKMPLADYLYMENRYKMLTKSKPEMAKKYLQMAQNAVKSRRTLYEHMAAQPYSAPKI